MISHDIADRACSIFNNEYTSKNKIEPIDLGSITLTYDLSIGRFSVVSRREEIIGHVQNMTTQTKEYMDCDGIGYNLIKNDDKLHILLNSGIEILIPIDGIVDQSIIVRSAACEVV